MFVDYVEIGVAAGKGGDGCVSFHREKFMPRGGPDGGDGGRGGNVVIVADSNLRTLVDFRYRKKYKAENGKPGEGGLRTGKSGAEIVLRVPVGSILKNIDNDQLIGDLDSPDKKIVVVRGGRGGKGNDHFKSSTIQAPRKATPGKPGESLLLGLELKLLADVGLVGLPNAGKSTLLARLSTARPKIADYPFTTLTPNLGIVRLAEYRSLVMADIPGIIEGASQGKGLGVRFLRHIQRTRILLFLIEASDPNPKGTLDLLKSELSDFDAKLAERPFMVALSKADLLDTKAQKEISNKMTSEYLLISGVSGQGLDTLLNRLENELERLKSS